MTTVEECDASLTQVTKRHQVLRQIIELIAKLRETDGDGADWIVEQISD